MSYYGGRSRLARLALEKLENDNHLAELNHSSWYRFDSLNQLGDSISSKFLELGEDAETTDFLRASHEKSEWFFTQLIHSVMLSLLKFFMSTTSVNGLLQRGSMFVFSMQQFQMLIEYRGIKQTRLLDLGAGDGETTLKMAPCFEKIYATEMSVTMQWRLKEKGFTVLDVNTWDQVTNAGDTVLQMESDNIVKFDVISCLNLLDRCDNPLTLLSKIKAALKPSGRLVVALVLPFKPYVEYNDKHEPKEFLFDMNRTFQTVGSSINESCIREPGQAECDASPQTNYKINKVNHQIQYLIQNIFEPIGFELVKFTKLPYLCEGNLKQSYYYMIDYVFLLRLKN